MTRGSKDVERLRRYWDRHSRSYDKQMAFFDRKLFGDSRQWVCSRAVGDVLASLGRDSRYEMRRRPTPPC